MPKVTATALALHFCALINTPLCLLAATVLHVLKHERCMFDASLFSLALYHALDTEYVVDYLGSDTYYCNRLVS